MIQSTLLASSITPPGAGLHVAIIMDGSGRWAERRGWPRNAGHRAGERAVRRVVEAARGAGIRVLTLFAFSGANWRRPAAESARLMEIFRGFFTSQVAAYRSQNVRVSVVGRRDRLPAALVASIEEVERETAASTGLHLRLAIDYSARDAMIAAAARLARLQHPAGSHHPAGSSGGTGTPACAAHPAGSRFPGASPERNAEAFAQALAETMHEHAPAPDVDLLIRTGGEQRLSDCLLWEGAFAEIVFSDCLWPDFGEAEFLAAIEEFHQRERRFGGVAEAIAG